MHSDLRQTGAWGDYLTKIDWHVEFIGKTQVTIKCLPFLNISVIKIQHATPPLPFAQIDAIAHKYHAALVVIEPDYRKYDESIYVKNGYIRTNFAYMHTATIMIDLKQTNEALLKSFSENARRNIKKSQNNNLAIEHIFLNKTKKTDTFDRFYDLFANLSRLKHFYLPPKKELSEKIIALRNLTFVSFAYEKSGSEPIAAIWFCYFDNMLYYLNTGATARGYELLANYLLVWEGLQEGQKHGLEIFDFGGIYDPRYPRLRQSAKKYSQFKKRFHGTLIEYPSSWIKFYSFPFKLFYLCSSRLFNW